MVAANNSILSDNFSTASRLQNCRKALRYGFKGEEIEWYVKTG